MEYKKSNREERLSPKRKRSHWCDRCDMDLVHIGEKCGACGFKGGVKTIKKETNAR